MKNINSSSNPWKGLNSYNIDDECKFCGRDTDINKLSTLIQLNQCVTLYGKSGIGKTSLIQAGVFPKLVMNNFKPVVVRLNNYINNEQSFAYYILSEIEPDITLDCNDKDIFCQFFSNAIFHDEYGNSLTPVIVLDQFEEVFTSYDKTELLLNQIIAWLNYRQPISSDCHFVISIREDDMYLLEEVIDTYRFNSLRTARYRLRGITRKDAEDIVRIPGENIITDENIVAHIIKQASKSSYNKIEYYEVAELSMLCSQLFNIMKNYGEEKLTEERVTKSGNASIKEYYLQLTKSLSKNEIELIEKNFITQAGRRNFISEENFKSIFNEKTSKTLLDSDNRILIKHNGRVEIIHDLLAKAIKEVKDEHILETNRLKDNIRSIYTWVSTLSLTVLTLWGIYLLYIPFLESIFYPNMAKGNIFLFLLFIINMLLSYIINIGIIKNLRNLFPYILLSILSISAMWTLYFTSGSEIYLTLLIILSAIILIYIISSVITQKKHSK